MTRQDVAKAIEVSIPGDGTEKTAIAQTLADFAIAKLARMPGVDFNRRWENFTLTASKSTYSLGSELFAGAGKIYNVTDMWRTDTSGWRINIIGTERFNAYARGTTTTGAPEIATVYGPPSNRTLEFYRIPDSAYTCGCMIEFDISGIEEIPARYWDVVFSIAMDLLSAAKNPQLAARLAMEGMRDIQRDGALGVSPSTIHSTRVIDQGGVYRQTDSGNLR